MSLAVKAVDTSHLEVKVQNFHIQSTVNKTKRAPHHPICWCDPLYLAAMSIFGLCHNVPNLPLPFIHRARYANTRDLVNYLPEADQICSTQTSVCTVPHC